MRMSAGNIKPTKKNSLGVNRQSSSTSNIISAQALAKSVQNMPSRPNGKTNQL